MEKKRWLIRNSLHCDFQKTRMRAKPPRRKEISLCVLASLREFFKNAEVNLFISMCFST